MPRPVDRAADAAGPGVVPPGIAAEIAAQGGRVTFARFMQLALTHPVDGCYCQTEGILGPRGHFSTAPLLSQAFCRAVGRLLEELIGASMEAQGPVAGAGGEGGVVLVELGAGEADLALALLQGWEIARPDFRDRLTYAILEVGEPLRARQRRILAKVTDRGWRVRWVDEIGEVLGGAAAAVVVGNEFIDALPVHLVDVRGEQALEAWVQLEPGGLREVWAGISTEAEIELRAAFGTAETDVLRPVTREGLIEVRPAARSLLQECAARVPSICLLTIDYGEWYAGPGDACTQAPAYGRTLRGYFRHQVVADPYLRVGRQDLTADVDFRSLDVHGREAGFETVLYGTVADLLRANGGGEELVALRGEAARAFDGALDADQQATVLEGLLDARGLGGVFKVILQVKEPTSPP